MVRRHIQLTGQSRHLVAHRPAEAKTHAQPNAGAHDARIAASFVSSRAFQRVKCALLLVGVSDDVHFGLPGQRFLQTHGGRIVVRRIDGVDEEIDQPYAEFLKLGANFSSMCLAISAL